MKKIVSWAGVYILIFLSVFVFFNQAWLKPFPAMKLYSGELQFSGEKAYETLNELVEKYPNRFIGSDAARASAEWMKDEFSKLGLDARLEKFDCNVDKYKVEGKLTPANYSSKEINKQVRGINVVAISPGKTEEAVIIGAHRDVLGSIQGAEDNGSGTVSLLELARVICSQEHYYTYIFLSFDGEEVGKGGSIDFVKRYSNSRIKLAYIMDMTGYNNANSIGFYPYMTPTGAAPLWTLALGNTILRENKLTPGYWLPGFNPQKNTWGLFSEILNHKIHGHINTDSAPFIDANIPAIGVMAAEKLEGMNNTGFGYRNIHSATDTLGQVSAKALELTGRFSERYIRSIELNKISWELSSRYYCINGTNYLSPVNIIVFFITAFILFGSLIHLSFRHSAIKVKDYFDFSRRQWVWLLGLAVYIALAVFLLQVMRTESIKLIPAIIRKGLLFLIAGLGCLYVVYKRWKYLMDKGSQFNYFITMQTGLLNHVYLLVCVVLLFFANPMKVLCIAAPAFLLMGRIRYQTIASKIVWFVVFGLWSVVEIWVIKMVFREIIYDRASLRTSMETFLCGFMWLCTFVFGFFTPPLPSQSSSATVTQ